VRPAKLATDIVAAVVSLFFFWQHDLVVGLVTHLIPPPIGSFAVIHFANLEGYKNSQLGAYLLRYMTPIAQATRLLGDHGLRGVVPLTDRNRGRSRYRHCGVGLRPCAAIQRQLTAIHRHTATWCNLPSINDKTSVTSIGQ
jgi:hypothetical protein